MPSLSAAERIRAISGANSRCSARKRSATSLWPTGGFDPRPPDRARRALRIEATSIASWISAPTTGTNNPNAPRNMNPRATPIPPITDCTAILRERCAIVIASTSRSRRSTTSTMSAASDDAVAPLAPMATPMSAAASAGASLSPSPTMIVTPCSRSAPTASTFSAGVRSDRIRSTPSAAPTDSATSG